MIRLDSIHIPKHMGYLEHAGISDFFSTQEVLAYPIAIQIDACAEGKRRRLSIFTPLFKIRYEAVGVE